MSAEFEDIRMGIEWDIAWQIFDYVNKENDTLRTIDLNCLGVFEAQSITKQCIYECARNVQNQGNPGFLNLNLFCPG